MLKTSYTTVHNIPRVFLDFHRFNTFSLSMVLDISINYFPSNVAIAGLFFFSLMVHNMFIHSLLVHFQMFYIYIYIYIYLYNDGGWMI